MSMQLLAITADGLAERRWRLMGRYGRSATEARAFFIARLRHSFSVVIAREMARRLRCHGAATDPPDRAWMIVTGWGVNDHSHLSKPILRPFT